MNNNDNAEIQFQAQFFCQNHSYESSSAASAFAFNDINSAGEVEDGVSQGADKAAFCDQSSLINIRDDQL